MSRPPAAAGAGAPVGRLHHVATADGHRLALRVVEPRAAPAVRPTLLLLHGLFSDGRFFLNGAGEGPARYFIDRGHRVCIGELRGHGRSLGPPGRAAWDWCFDDHVRHDLPALIGAATALAPEPLFVLAHSMAGYALLAALGLQPALQQALGGVCLLSAAVNDYREQGLRKRLALHAAALLAGLAGRFPARALRLGVADEPARLMRQFVRWAPEGRFCSEDGRTDYWAALARVCVPVLAGVGAADRFHASPARGRRLVAALGSADRSFIELGRAGGLQRDYGHVDVLRGAAAEREVLPRLAEWMAARRVGPSRQCAAA